jgi:hypothetical protein
MSDDTLFGFIANHPVRLIVYTLCAALGHFIYLGIKTWWKEWSSRLCRGGHKKKYVELFQYTNYDCKGQHWQIHSENDEWWATVGRWVCEEPGCTAYGKTCFGHKKIFWKIEHGKVVPDKKLMESPPPNLLSPKREMARRRAEKQQQGHKDLTFDDVFRAAEQAMLKNAKRMTERIEGRDYGVQKQSVCDCGCECDPQFVAGVGELPRPKCDPLRHPQHHDIDVILAAKKKWSEEQKAKEHKA